MNIDVAITPPATVNTTVTPSASSVLSQVSSSQPSSFILVEPTGTAAEQTTRLVAALDRAMRMNVAVILSGDYSINGPILLSGTGVLRLEVRSKSTIHYTGNSAINYLVRLSSTENSVVISGQPLSIDGANLVRSAIRLDRTSETAAGFVSLSDVSVANCRNTDNAVSIQVAGIECYGYSDVEYLRCSASNIRNTGNAANTAVVGLSASQYHRTCRIIDCYATDIRNTLLADADGLKAFGRGQVTPPTYRPQRAVIDNCVLTDCQGRGVKIQVSESIVSNTTIRQLTVPSIEHGVGIAFQWGNGTVENCKIELAKDMVGASYSVINFQNVLNGAELQRSTIDGLIVQSIDIVPRIVLVSEETVSKNTSYDFRRIFGTRPTGSLVERAFVEIVNFQDLITKGKRTSIVVRDCELPTEFAIVGYTGYTSGSFPLLSVDLTNIRNTLSPVANTCRPVNNISGARLTSFAFRFEGLSNINSVFSTDFHCDFSKLASTSFGFVLGGASVSVANGPAGLPNALYWVEVLGQWFPAEYNVIRLTNLDTGAVYLRQHSTWRQIVAATQTP